MEYTNAMSVINYNPTTKDEIETFVNKIVGEVENGAINPLELHVKIKAIESCLAQVSDKIKDAVMDEMQNYQEKNVEMFGAKIAKAETGVKYDYTVCGDPVLNSIMSDKKVLEQAEKNRQAFLKAANPNGTEIVCDDEVVKIYPPIKTSSSFIKVTLK